MSFSYVYKKVYFELRQSPKKIDTFGVDNLFWVHPSVHVSWELDKSFRSIDKLSIVWAKLGGS